MPTSNTSHFEADHHLSPSSSSSDMSNSGEIGAHRHSSVSDCMSEVDLEMGREVMKSHSGKKSKRDCRICHLGLESNEEVCGEAIELGCCCKGDLGAAHRKCAETWFKIKGNMTCEICGATAVNVANERPNDAQNVSADVSTAPAAPMILAERRAFWHSRRVMNILLACMLLAFMVSWLFHFKILT